MRELVKNYDIWDVESDKFDHTVTVWKEDDKYYQLHHPARRGSFNLNDLPAPSPIPMELFKGRWQPSLTEAPNPPPIDSYLKSPEIVVTGDYDAKVARADEEGDHKSWGPRDDMVAEAKIYEILKQNPHPNICIYYGCMREGDYLTALCLKKYGRSLQETVRSGDGTLDAAAILAGISNGIHFLHNTFGLVHNDINPGNIMLDDAGNAVIIDFDSCMEIGQEIGGRKAGTFGWEIQPPPPIALPENDLYGLMLLSRFMDREIY